MEIIFLNTLNGQLRDPLTEFIASQTGKTNIFCLQEVHDGDAGMRQLATALLPDYKEMRAHKPVNDKEIFSQATYIHSKISIKKPEVLFPDDLTLGLGLVTQVEYLGNPLAICNFHGRPQPGNKHDTPERLAQSQGTLDYFQTFTMPVIIGGDFNLDPNTTSVKLFKEAGFRNLIVENGIQTTRNKIAWKNYPLPLYHSDYVFVSKNVQVSDFEVPQNEISDHLPLILSID